MFRAATRWSSPFFFFFFNDTATTEIYTLSLHDALPISTSLRLVLHGSILACKVRVGATAFKVGPRRSEEHTSELQSLAYLVCRLLLEKKKKKSSFHSPSKLNNQRRLSERVPTSESIVTS